MTPTWLIEGRDPLIFRDGRPLGGNAPIETLDFPLPSTIAGAVRGRLATDPKTGRFMLRDNDAALAELLMIPVRGPLLAQLQPDGQFCTWLFPAPRDALVREPDTGLSIAPLRPGALSPGESIDAIAENRLRPLFPAGGAPRAKPPAAPIVFWNHDAFESWLMGHPPSASSPDALGIRALPHEPRMHVSMRPGERVAEDGALFETVGLRFVHTDGAARQRLSHARHFALAFNTPGGDIAGRPLQLHPGLAPIGGERRLARWSPTSAPWPVPPRGLADAVYKSSRARLILLTPAIFEEGALPAWNSRPWPGRPDLRVTVEAAAVPPAQVVSGWDLKAKDDQGRIRGAPKPTRRMAPAGSVYFVRLDGPASARHAWLESTWLHSISDKPQDRLDGFGLAAIGTWSD